MLLASSASAHVFDPQASFLYLQLGGLTGSNVRGQATATANGTLTGGVGSEQIVTKGKGMGLPNLFQAVGVTNGPEFFTGTPNIDNLFFTVQNTSGTFSHGSNFGTFQSNALCATGCFGGEAGILGQVLVRIAGPVDVPVPVPFIGAGGKASVGGFKNEGAQWVTAAVPITGIATNVVRITNNGTVKGGVNARSGVTGIGFTLQLTVNENSDLLQENGVTAVSVRGSTAFQTANATSGVNQVSLVSPVHSDASAVTGNPAIPGVAIMVLRYVPEPGTLVLLGSAVAGLLVVGRKRMKR
jgi:hypothetical protein